MDISSLYSIGSPAIRQTAENSPIGKKVLEKPDLSFDSVLKKAVENINTTNSYLSDMENEEIRWALGETNSTHELSVAMNKAATALQYTVAVLINCWKHIKNLCRYKSKKSDEKNQIRRLNDGR